MPQLPVGSGWAGPDELVAQGGLAVNATEPVGFLFSTVQNKNMTATAEKSDARWARTRQRLIEGGRRVFAEAGVDGATVLEVVRAAGVSQPSFYNHFASKDELALEIATDYFRQDVRLKQQVFERLADPAEAIAINVAQTLAIVTEDPVVAWVLVRSESLRHLLVSGDSDSLAAMIQAGNDGGRFDVPDPQTVALCVRGAALAMVQDMLGGSAAQDKTNEFQELVLRMLGLNAADSREVARRARGHMGVVLEELV